MVPVMETTEEVPGNTENEFVFNAAPVEPTIRQPPAGVVCYIFGFTSS